MVQAKISPQPTPSCMTTTLIVGLQYPFYSYATVTDVQYCYSRLQNRLHPHTIHKVLLRHIDQQNVHVLGHAVAQAARGDSRMSAERAGARRVSRRSAGGSTPHSSLHCCAMTTTPFTPYWKPVGGPATGPPRDTYSWVFFVVAQIAGRHRPVAVVSSLGDNLFDETLQGYFLTAACQCTITIFTDRANHPAIRAELALAAAYYMRDGDHEYCQEPVELPELNCTKSQIALRRRPWDYTGIQEFPFIAACLLQGVGFDTREGVTCAACPELLGTVYRDTSIE
jgi:hypothetical protein